MNEALENIFNRKSVRNFTTQKVSDDDIDLIIRAGMAAPSAINLQPWEFIILEDKDTLQDMADIHEYSGMFRTATLGIIVLGNMNRSDKRFRQLWVQDCSAATENILLAAEALGYGAVWTAIYPVDERINALIKYFNLPENIVPFSLIAVGKSNGEDKVKNKYDKKKIHFEKW